MSKKWKYPDALPAGITHEQLEAMLNEQTPKAEDYMRRLMDAIHEHCPKATTFAEGMGAVRLYLQLACFAHAATCQLGLSDEELELAAKRLVEACRVAIHHEALKMAEERSNVN